MSSDEALMRVRSSTAETAAVDRLVLVTVNAPYKSDIGATALSECLAHADLGTWPVHVATFFTDVETDLVFRFAASHGIAKSALAKAYLVMRAATGERNPVLEAELVPLGAGRRQAVEPRLHLA